MWVKFLIMIWCGFIGRGNSSSSLGVNGECDQVKKGEAALELEEFSWLDLPNDVVVLILHKLRCEDGMKFACVCKTWRDIIERSTPIYPASKSPLLIHVKSRGGGRNEAILHCHSPLLNKTFQVFSPMNLRSYEIISATEGDLLIYNQDLKEIWLINPFNGSSSRFGPIPGNISFNGTAIGVYDDYDIIFLIDTSDENQITVHFFHEGWTLDLVFEGGNKSLHLSSNPVYCDGRFYCLGSDGDRLGVFSLLERTWQLHSTGLDKYVDDIHCCCCYLVDWIDTVMAVCVENNGSRIQFFLLNQKSMLWEKTDDLRGRSLFLGSTGSVMVLPTTERLQNRVFLPHFHQDEPKTAIVGDPVYFTHQWYFKPKSCISSREKLHAATTLCCCSSSGEELLHLDCSTQDDKYCTVIWYHPFYKVDLLSEGTDEAAAE